MNCLRCADMDLDQKPMAKHGFGHCKHEPIYCYVSINKPKCCEFKEAKPAILEKRIEWAAKFNDRG